MRTLVFLFSSLLIISCTMKTLSKQQKENVFTHKVDLSQKELKQKITQFIAENFNSAKSVIQTNDDNLISGNGILNLSTNFMGMSYDMNMTFLIKYEDHQYKLKTILKNITLSSATDPIPVNVHPGNWQYHLSDVKRVFKEFDAKLYTYITNKDSEF